MSPQIFELAAVQSTAWCLFKLALAIFVYYRHTSIAQTEIGAMATGDKYNEVEVIIPDDPWAKFGSPLPDRLPASKKRYVTSTHRWGIRSAAALLTLGLHLLVFSPLLLGTSSRKSRPPLTEGAAASANNADESEFVSALVLLNDRSTTDPETHEDLAYYPLVKEVDKMLQNDVVIAELTGVSRPASFGSEDSKDDNSTTAETTGDDVGRAKLFGLYMGQVKARIERAWDYPATPFTAKFQCKVAIMQGEHGDVKEVVLQHCNGNAAWQVSLVQAIQRASPLPAPPSEKVFTSTLNLGFEAVPPPVLVDASHNVVSNVPR